MMNRILVAVAAFLLCLSAAAPAQGWAGEFLGKSMDRWQKDLKAPDAKARRSAAFALGRMGEDGQSAVSLLATRLRDDREASVRDMAAAAIGDIAKALKGGRETLWNDAGGELVNALKNDASPHVRRSAAYALGAFGPQASGANNDLRAALQDANASVRQNAAWALGQIGEDARQAVTALRECLSDKDTLVRRDAAGALGSMGKAGAAGVSSLIDLVKSEPDEVVKKTALYSLSHLAGPEHKSFARGLEPLLDSKDFEIALGAALVLARIGGTEGARGLPVLRKALKDPDPENQKLAVVSLGELGPAAAPAMFDLATTLTNAKNSTEIRGYAALSIAHIGPAAKPVVPALAQSLQADQPLEVRQNAAEAMGQLKYPATEKALPAILNAIEKDPDPLVRQKCVWSLFPMSREDMEKTKADKALAKVIEEPPGKMNLVRYDAARKLATYLEDDAPNKTADVLLEMLKNTDLRVYNSTDAKVEGAGNEASSGKVNVRQNTGGDARYMAVKALGCMPKVRKRADIVQALKGAAEDSNAKLSKEAKEALKNIGVK